MSETKEKQHWAIEVRVDGEQVTTIVEFRERNSPSLIQP